MARRDATFEAVEELMIEAWQLLMRLPDRERGWLKSGSRSAWPPIVRDAVMDYADGEAAPRRQLGRKEMALVRMVFLAERCLTGAIPARDKPLVALVVAMRASKARMVGGFQWSTVWQALGGVLPVDHALERVERVTSDAMRKRYERAITLVVQRYDAIGDGVRDAA